MEYIQRQPLLQAELEGRFSAQKNEYHVITDVTKSSRRIFNSSLTYHQRGQVTHLVFTDEYDLEAGCPPAAFSQSPTRDEDRGYEQLRARELPNSLRCVLQKNRVHHVSGRPDALPFKSAQAMLNLFSMLSLPSSFFQVTDGSPATAKAHTFYDQGGRPRSFELVANCLTKQGHWAMALSHQAAIWSSAVYWNMDDRIDSGQLVEDLETLQQYASHPVLTPCIMFAETFRIAVKRRHSIKARLESLETALARLSEQADRQDHDSDLKISYEPPSNLGHLFELVQSCRKDQSSRKGRYDFWRTFHGSIQEGFRYTEAILKEAPDERRFEQNAELQHWVDMMWQRLQSLMARDKDHIHRVENAATTLHNLVQQREIRLQSSIASAARRDSEDMKYIAVLGSVFLPAGLVASIFNVPEFQFLPGPQLFGAYLGITIPFIAIVVVLCLSRPYWARWRFARGSSSGPQRRESVIIEKSLLRSPSHQA